MQIKSLPELNNLVEPPIKDAEQLPTPSRIVSLSNNCLKCRLNTTPKSNDLVEPPTKDAEQLPTPSRMVSLLNDCLEYRLNHYT